MVLLYILSAAFFGLCCAIIAYLVELSWLLIPLCYSFGGALGMFALAALEHLYRCWLHHNRS